MTPTGRVERRETARPDCKNADEAVGMAETNAMEFMVQRKSMFWKRKETQEMDDGSTGEQLNFYGRDPDKQEIDLADKAVLK